MGTIVQWETSEKLYFSGIKLSHPYHFKCKKNMFPQFCLTFQMEPTACNYIAIILLNKTSLCVDVMHDCICVQTQK